MLSKFYIFLCLSLDVLALGVPDLSLIISKAVMPLSGYELPPEQTTDNGVQNKARFFSDLFGSEVKAPQDLPMIDLGYEIYRATKHDSSNSHFEFTNIRYAQAPVGNLRFAAPQDPLENRDKVQDDSKNKICAQSVPESMLSIVSDALVNLGFPRVSPSTNVTDGIVTEDCLLLDVYVPDEVWNARNSTKAPVLVWIAGGAFLFNHKKSFTYGSPNRLLRNGMESLVFVSINYRLGPLGFISGDQFEAEGGKSNVGLLDQRKALDWVVDNVSKFGGDPERITVMGESAGAASIMHHITAYGGARGRPPFNKAIIQSPGFLPTLTQSKNEVYEKYLNVMKVSNLAEARNLSSEKAIEASMELIRGAPLGTPYVGPVIDGDYVPDLPGILIKKGQFHKDIRLMINTNAREGVVFTPIVKNQSEFLTGLSRFLPGASDEIYEKINKELYPQVFNGTYDYTDQTTRLSRVIGDLIFDCNANYMMRTFNETYVSEFRAWPAIHAQDNIFTFHDGNLLYVQFRIFLAAAMQSAIQGFVFTNNPGYDAYDPVKDNPVKFFQSKLQYSGRSVVGNNQKCNFWQDNNYLSSMKDTSRNETMEDMRAKFGISSRKRSK